MVFNATFNNISVLLGEGNQSTTDLLKVTEKLSHKVVSSTPHHEWDSNSQL